MEKEKIIFLSHCMLNKSSKVKYYGEEKNREKDEKIRKF